MQKDTSKIVEELGLCPDFTTFYNENKQYLIKDTLSEMLEQLLVKKGLKKSAVIKEAEMSEVYGYQIFSGLRIPERNKLLCLAIAMKLNIDEMQVNFVSQSFYNDEIAVYKKRTDYGYYVEGKKDNLTVFTTHIVEKK